MDKKIAIIGTGNILAHYVASTLADENVKLLAVDEAKDTGEIRSEMADIILHNPYKDINLDMRYVPSHKAKPTCERNHEYVQYTKKEGNLIHSEWRCRFCDKKLS
jgi:uncharacterized UPF0146 family protein